MALKLYNTLTKQLEYFEPLAPQEFYFYTCGPTVYDDAHIGNFRSFLEADLLRRWLESPLCTLQKDAGNTDNPVLTRRVVHVMNITDVGHMTDDTDADGAGEDKMEVAARRISEAKKSGTLPPDSGVNEDDPFAIARFYEHRFKQDAIALGLKVAIEAQTDPSLMPRATDNIPQMRQVIESLLRNGYAYPAGEPGRRAIYFDVQRFQSYGQLSGNTLDHLRGGAGGRVDDTNQSEKKHPADFLLWKEDATHKMKWPSPKVPAQSDWGEGYPGWHIECTAMALGRLIDDNLTPDKIRGATIDLHSGGEDNIFPHHECEIAQSCCFTGAPTFARHWFHPRFLKVDGQKMSKSKGTMYTLRDLTAKGFDPAAIRLELIKTHYRANADFSIQGLKDSERRIKIWRRDVKEMMAVIDDQSLGWNFSRFETLTGFEDALNDDLNIAGALAVFERSRGSSIAGYELDEAKVKSQLDKAVEKVSLPDQPMSPEEAVAIWRDESKSGTERSLAATHLIDNILGVIFRPIEKSQDTGIALYQPGVTPSPEIESLLQQRADAKKSKDFAAADAIRDQLSAMGLAIMDKPGGQVEVAIAN